MTHQKKISMEDLDFYRQCVSIEAVTLTTTGSEAVSRLTDLVKGTKSFLSEKTSSLYTSLFNMFYWGSKNKDPELVTMFKQTKTDLKNFKYTDIRNLEVQVPEGFTGNFTSYLELLAKISKNFSNNLVTDFIQPFDLYIGKMIANNTLITSSSYTHNATVKDIEKYRKDIAKYFKGTRNNVAKIGDIFNNIKDIDLAIDVGIDTWYVLGDKKNIDVKDSVDQLNDKLIRLIDIINDKSNNISVSPKVLKELSQLTYDLAKLVEFYAVVNQLTATACYRLSDIKKYLTDK